jgi:predicted AAA+ superfamily ATPase
MINRLSFVTELQKWKNSTRRKPLLVLGARQVGKTFIIKYFAENNFQKLHYVNFEEEKQFKTLFESSLTPQRILEDLSILLHTEIDVDQDLVFFDEIQSCPSALTSLKYFREKMPKLHLVAAGSLLGVMLPQASFPVGQVDILHLYPLSFEEFLAAIGEKRLLDRLQQFEFSPRDQKATQIKHNNETLSAVIHEALWKFFKVYLFVGGLPEVVALFASDPKTTFENINHVVKLQSTILNTYLADIAKHSGEVKSMHIERVLQNIPTQLGKNLDGSVGRFMFKDVVPGVSSYSGLVGAIDWLEKAGLLSKVKICSQATPPLTAWTKESRFKLFIFDCGILRSLAALAPESILKDDYGSYRGFVAENFVARTIQASLANTSMATSLYGWNESTAEIEFLFDSQGDIIPIEVKSGSRTQAKSLKVFCERYQPKFSILLSAQVSSFDSTKKIHRIPLYAAERMMHGLMGSISSN